jgi:hypothetical protein
MFRIDICFFTSFFRSVTVVAAVRRKQTGEEARRAIYRPRTAGWAFHQRFASKVLREYLAPQKVVFETHIPPNRLRILK